MRTDYFDTLGVLVRLLEAAENAGGFLRIANLPEAQRVPVGFVLTLLEAFAELKLCTLQDEQQYVFAPLLLILDSRWLHCPVCGYCGKVYIRNSLWR